VDPVSDIETVEIEFMLADMQTLDTALPRAERSAKSGDPEALVRAEVIRKCQAHLAKNEPLRKLKLSPDEMKVISSFGLMSAKPILYVANVDENDLAGKGPLVQQVREFAAKVGAEIIPVCAKLEAEIAELEPADRAEMLSASGLAEPALAVLVRAAYRALGLQSYFTAGEKEVRAWTVPVGATAPQGAGVIHTDFEKGFIRVEVYSLADLETYKNEKAIRAAGKLRVEGKAYVLQDGDICHFLFN
jgi:ribosome-binding ATPase